MSQYKKSPFALAWTSFCNKLFGFRTEFATINVTNMSICFKKGTCLQRFQSELKLKTFLEMSDSV